MVCTAPRLILLSNVTGTIIVVYFVGGIGCSKIFIQYSYNSTDWTTLPTQHSCTSPIYFDTGVSTGTVYVRLFQNCSNGSDVVSNIATYVFPTPPPTRTPTKTPTLTPTKTPTKTPTNTPTKTPTNTPTKTPTPTRTPTPTKPSSPQIPCGLSGYSYKIS